MVDKVRYEKPAAFVDCVDELASVFALCCQLVCTHGVFAHKGGHMRVVIASDAEGMSLKEIIKDVLIADGHEVVDYSEEPAADFVDSALAVARDLLEHEDSLGFAFDGYGVGSYMAATRVKGMVAANISDERSAYMTREHNNCRMVCMGPKVVGPEVATKIAREFLAADYAAGRHQIRVDMLNKMA